MTLLTIKQLLNYSWMSQASYLDFSGFATGADIESKLKDSNSPVNPDKILATEQAKLFTGSATANPTDGFSPRRADERSVIRRMKTL